MVALSRHVVIRGDGYFRRMVTFERRPAAETDVDAARAMHHRAYRDVVVRQFGEWDGDRQDQFFADDWDAAPVDVVVVDGEMAGYCSIIDVDDAVHVRELVIDPSFQGRGIGGALLRQAIERAAARGVKVHIGALHENRSLQLYRRVGFVETGSTDTHTLLEWSPLAPPGGPG